MGSGIAQVFAEKDFEVTLVDISTKLLQKSISLIKGNLERALKKGTMTERDKNLILKRIKTTTDQKHAAAKADFILEAIVESLPAKKTLFKDLDRLSNKDAIIATNTSTLSVTKIASAHRRPQNIVGMHFFNPPHLIPLVEVVKGSKTSNRALNTVRSLAHQLGKVPVGVSDTPGFIVNKLLLPYLNDACLLLEKKVSGKEEIDEAMKIGCGYPMGPFELMDLIGLDVALAIIETLYTETQESRFKPSSLLRRMVKSGHLGRKSGRGFYTYS